MTKGWYNQHYRHSLAARGIRTSMIYKGFTKAEVKMMEDEVFAKSPILKALRDHHISKIIKISPGDPSADIALQEGDIIDGDVKMAWQFPTPDVDKPQNVNSFRRQGSEIYIGGGFFPEIIDGQYPERTAKYVDRGIYKGEMYGEKDPFTKLRKTLAHEMRHAYQNEMLGKEFMTQDLTMSSKLGREARKDIHNLTPDELKHSLQQLNIDENDFDRLRDLLTKKYDYEIYGGFPGQMPVITEEEKKEIDEILPKAKLLDKSIRDYHFHSTIEGDSMGFEDSKRFDRYSELIPSLSDDDRWYNQKVAMEAGEEHAVPKIRWEPGVEPDDYG